jgi:hypothetical protein
MGQSFGPSSAGRVGLFSSSFQYSPVGADLVFLLLDDESERSHIAWAWVGAKVRLTRVKPSCKPNLIMRDHLTAVVCPVSVIIGSVLISVVVRRHHAVASGPRDRIVTDFTQCWRVDVVGFDVGSDLDHEVRVVDVADSLGEQDLAELPIFPLASG